MRIQTAILVAKALSEFNAEIGLTVFLAEYHSQDSMQPYDLTTDFRRLEGVKEMTKDVPMVKRSIAN